MISKIVAKSRWVNLFLFSILTIGCQSEDNNNVLSWGETAETEKLEITPTEIEVGTADNQLPGREVEPHAQIAVIDITLENTSDSSLVLDRDFYYESFGITVEGETGIGRMDTNAFPFDGVFLGDLKAGETVDTRLEIYNSLGQMYLVFDHGGDLGSGSEVRWNIE
ncbi:hypothetical protein [Evansella clarkii]|uniref:hypothetical protein n=1 Tax=Evansella clarkii TaxID=79879 RepID=UPI00099808BC|nr:hypothetical protein [Evansella clarkii]